MTFTDSELGDIRIALQDRIKQVQQASSDHMDRNKGISDPSYRIEIDRLHAIVAKVVS